MSLGVGLPQLPPAPQRFDAENEAQFRRMIERVLREIIQRAGSGGGGGGGGTLDGLSDVNITSPANGAVLKYDSGSGTWIDAADATGAPTDAQYVVVTTNATLTAERVLAVTAPITITDGGAGNNVSLALDRSREDDVLTTASIASGSTDQGTWNIGCPVALLLSLQADRACRVRLYTTSAARAADLSRTDATDPDAGAGVLAEYIFTGASTEGAEPPIVLKNMDSPVANVIYYAVQNRSGATSTVTLTAKLLKLED